MKIFESQRSFPEKVHSQVDYLLKSLRISSWVALGFILFPCLLPAQKAKVNKQVVGAGDRIAAILPSTDRPDWVEIYENNNFRGRVARYAQSVPDFTYPSIFQKRNVSLKVAPGYIAYISFREEFPTEGIFIGDHSTFGSINRHDIHSIRVVQAQRAHVNFCGISTQIHNNDCKRVFGSIKLKMYERLTSGALIPCPLVEVQGNPLRSRSRLDPGPYDTTTLFSHTNNFSGLHLFGGSNQSYVFEYDGRRAPDVRNTFVLFNGNSAGNGFLVSEEALRNDRIIMEIVVNLGAQHKSNDLATDYASRLMMQRPETRQIAYRSSPTAFNLGDFNLQGNPDHSIMARGVAFSINKTLRVHLNKEVTPAPIRNSRASR